MAKSSTVTNQKKFIKVYGCVLYTLYIIYSYFLKLEKSMKVLMHDESLAGLNLIGYRYVTFNFVKVRNYGYFFLYHINYIQS